MDRGSTFNLSTVARCYDARPPYAPAALDLVLRATPRRSRALDIGCGPGKLTTWLAGHFDDVVGVDVSGEMLAIATQDAPGNITYIEGKTEDSETGGGFNVVTAGASIHWMDHPKLHERLRQVTKPGASLFVIDGDGPFEAPWASGWEQFMRKWLPVATGKPYTPAAQADFRQDMSAFSREFRVFDSDTRVSEPFSQSVADYIRCQHSRDSFAEARLGDDVGAFDADLRVLLSPWTVDGQVTYRVATTVTRCEIG